MLLSVCVSVCVSAFLVVLLCSSSLCVCLFCVLLFVLVLCLRLVSCVCVCCRLVCALAVVSALLALGLFCLLCVPVLVCCCVLRLACAGVFLFPPCPVGRVVAVPRGVLLLLVSVGVCLSCVALASWRRVRRLRCCLILRRLLRLRLLLRLRRCLLPLCLLRLFRCAVLSLPPVVAFVCSPPPLCCCVRALLGGCARCPRPKVPPDKGGIHQMNTTPWQAEAPLQRLENVKNFKVPRSHWIPLGDNPLKLERYRED